MVEGRCVAVPSALVAPAGWSACASPLLRRLSAAVPHCAPRPPALRAPPQLNAFATIWRTEGPRGFYRGWAANSLKVIPQNAIRFVSYEALKGLLCIARAKTDT